MPAIISEKFRIFNAKQFLESFSEGTPSGSGGDQSTDRTRMYFFIGAPRPWKAYMEIYGQNSTAFTIGGTVSATGGFTGTISEVYPYALYFSTTSGTPTLAGTLTGGGTSAGATAKVGVYRSADENNAPSVLDNQKEKFANYKDITALKRITETDVKSVIARYNFNTSLYPNFDMWRPDYSSLNTSLTGASSLSTTRHIIMNTNYEVFMCIYNGAGVDGSNNIVKGLNMTYVPKVGLDGTANQGKYTPPAGQAITASGGIYAETNSSGVVLGGTNGYMWKHLYTISTSDVLKFVSTDFVPVVYDTLVQGAAALSGTIEVAVVKDRGSGLPASFYAPVIGDGTTQAVVYVTTSGGLITGVKVMNGAATTVVNAGYTWGEVYLKHNFMYQSYTPSTNTLGSAYTTGYPNAAGKIEVIIPPQGGYGSDVLSDTSAKRVMVNVRLEGLDSLDFPVDNDFRRIGILQDPLAPGGTYLTSVAASGLNSLKVTGLTTGQAYTPDEIIYQSSSNAYGTVVSYQAIDSTSGIIYYFQSPELHRHTDYKVYAFTTGTTVLGQTSTLSKTVDATYGILAPEVKVNSGEMIYVENRKFISRAADQIEDIKLVVEF
jgi:hypothetical protein